MIQQAKDLVQDSPSAHATPASPRRSTISPRGALLLAAWLGLFFGYLDLAGYVFRTDILHATAYYKQARFFPWAVPLANLVILMVPGLVIAGVNRIWSGLLSVRDAAWALLTLGLWGALLNFPLHAAASLVLAAGLGRWISRLADLVGPRLRWWGRLSLIGMAGSLAVIAAVTVARQMQAQSRFIARLPAPPPAGSPNVLLIVLDTVRADNLSLYGYPRATTPSLARWANRGVRFDWALAPSCWTYPSHCSFFTGRWPRDLDSHWHPVLDTPAPTVAEFLASRGYDTAGFAANTRFCSYESGMARGFAHYEDYPLSARTILGTTAVGRWITKYVLCYRDLYGRKWAQYQSRDAREMNRAFLGWLTRAQKQQVRRPFFAFLNYLDAHGPFLPPADHLRRLGMHPESWRDYEMLLDFGDRDKSEVSTRDVTLARDGYDDCVAFLDSQVGALLDELDGRGLLANTVVMITSDHGEEFGEHGLFYHGHSLYLDLVHVPLIVLAPTVPAARTVAGSVSLRDLPATIADLLGLASDSPFPGSSLAAHWRGPSANRRPKTSPAFSEVDIGTIGPNARRGDGPFQRGYTTSHVAGDWHFIRDATGAEMLYDLARDPSEAHNLAKQDALSPTVLAFRQSLLEALNEPAARDRPEPERLKQYRARLQALTPVAQRRPGS
jgi:arylsulfatase A-like enzyme